MASRKYVGDYRLENQTTPEGKIKVVPVYKGAQYVFEAGEERVAVTARLYAACAAIYWLAQIAALVLNTRCARAYWVILPLAFSMLSVGFLTVGTWALLTADRNMTRATAERIRDRISGGSLMSMVLTGAALVGTVVTMIIYRAELFIPADIIFAALVVIETAISVVAFLNRRYVRVRALSAPAASPEDVTGDTTL